MSFSNSDTGYRHRLSFTHIHPNKPSDTIILEVNIFTGMYRIERIWFLAALQWYYFSCAEEALEWITNELDTYK